MFSNSKNRVISIIAIATFIIAVIFLPGLIPNNVKAATSAFSKIEAENYTSLSPNGIKIIDIAPNGRGLGYINKGNYAVYNDIDFGSSGAVSFKAKVATQNNVSIEIRVGSTTGTLLGTLSLTSTGSYDTYKEISCSVNKITGTHNIYLVFSNAVNIDWFTFIADTSSSPTPTPAPTTVSSGVLKVEFFNSNRNSPSNSINFSLKITNTGNSPIDLSTVKLRYYYTIDGVKPISIYCDYSSVQTSYLKLSNSSMGQTCSNADHYIEVGFTNGAGTLAPGSNAVVQVRSNKNDWSNFIQTNDYSYNASAIDFTSWTYVTGYINNTLVWGIEPTSSSSTSAPVITATPVATATPIITPAATATSIPQTSIYLQIEAENYSNINGQSIKKITLPGGFGLGYISYGDYAEYNSINFGQGVSLFKARVAAAKSTNIEIRVGSETGTLIGNLSVPSTGSWDNYQEISCNISNAIKGINNLYLVFNGPVNIDWFVIAGASNIPSSTPVPTSTPVSVNRSAFVEIQAENYDYTNAKYIQSIGISGGGTAIGYLLSDDYIVFNNVIFGSGTNSFKARVATQNATSVEIRSESASGTLLATISIPSTGDWNTYQEISQNIPNITGTKTLCIVFKGPINFDWFVFSPISTSDSIDAFSRIEAENYTGASSSNIKKIGNVICYIQSGNYVVFNNVNFGNGAKSFKAYAVNASGSTTDIEIREGSSTGTLLGTLSVPSVSSWDEFQEFSCNISTVKGKINLYLVFTGPVNVDWFTFSAVETVPTSTPTPIPTLAPSPTAAPTVSVIPTSIVTIDQPNINLSRVAPPRVEIASIQTISSTQDGELTLSGLGTLLGEKEIVLVVDNAISNEHVMRDIITPLDYAIFANKNLSGVGDGVNVIGNVHANGKLESYIANLKVSGICSASTLSIGYGSILEGGIATISSPLPMPKFHDNIISEIQNEDYKFYPSEFSDSSDRQFPNQPGFNIRYEANNNTFVITGAGTFNLESSMYFDGNLRISVPHIVNTNSNFLVAKGFISLEGHDINPAELDENSINNTTNLLNVYSIHGRILVTTENSKIYGTLYAAGEEDPTGQYTNDVGVIIIQGINIDIYGSVIAGSDIRLEGSSSRFYYVPEMTSKVESKYLRTVTLTSAKSAAQQIVDLFEGTNTKMYALQYSDKAYVDMESFRFFDLSKANETSALREHINNFPKNETGFSNTGDALRRGKDLLSHPTKSSADATKYIIVLAANAPNKWTSSIDNTTGNAIVVEGDGTIDADGNALNYALDMAAQIKNSGIKAVFINNSPKDITANIEKLAVASGAPSVDGDKHYYNSASMLDFSPVYKYVILDPPKNAVVKNATYSEIFPEGIQIVENPAGSRIDQVEGTTRQKLTIENLDIKLTYDGTKYIIEPFTIEIKFRPKKIGNITFRGSDSKITYSIEYVDANGNIQTAEFEKHFSDFTLNVYMNIDIS
ncbi:carbohydrate-binding protein [Acetivibrio clariflavus]|uniref:carbohydrate-binding protein n=1 Tax=Acetivibrio clariflavus TaxID=288965 RepID=UPI000486C887|nr:carbohydrate-binding protein [Acetivibrio clariflavus]